LTIIFEIDKILSMIKLTQKTAPEIGKELAERLKHIRKRRKISQELLASRSGVSYGSIKRFEQTGQCSLQTLIQIAIALEVEEEFDGLFLNVPYRSIKEVINESSQ